MFTQKKLNVLSDSSNFIKNVNVDTSQLTRRQKLQWLNAVIQERRRRQELTAAIRSEVEADPGILTAGAIEPGENAETITQSDM